MELNASSLTGDSASSWRRRGQVRVDRGSYLVHCPTVPPIPSPSFLSPFPPSLLPSYSLSSLTHPQSLTRFHLQLSQSPPTPSVPRLTSLSGAAEEEEDGEDEEEEEEKEEGARSRSLCSWSSLVSLKGLRGEPGSAWQKMAFTGDDLNLNTRGGGAPETPF